MARSTPSDPFYQINGAPLGILDVATPFILVALFYGALRDRRSAQLHARYMLATSLPLVEPAVGALTGWMGWTAGLASRKLKAATT